MNDVIIYIAAAFFLLMGLVALVNPPYIASFLSLKSLPRDMRHEVRAVYGGFGIAMSAVLIAATRVDSIRSGVILTVSLALLGMAAGRLVSLSVDRSVGKYPNLFLAGELLLGGLLLLSWMSLANMDS